MKSKITSLFSILMIAMMVSGISYAMWSKTLYISGTTKTGTLNARFSYQASSDPYSPATNDTESTTSWTFDPGTHKFTWTGAKYNKNVANTNCSITTTTTLNDTLSVSMGNVYPSYNASVAFTIDNTGTIPFNAYLILPLAVTPPAGGSAKDLTIGLGGFVNGTQVDAGGYVLGWIWVHVEESAVQNATYTFSTSFIVAQWNEPLH